MSGKRWFVVSDLNGRLHQLRRYVYDAQQEQIRVELPADHFIVVGNIAQRLSPVTDFKLICELIKNGQLSTSHMVFGAHDVALFRVAACLAEPVEYVDRLFSDLRTQLKPNQSRQDLVEACKQQALNAQPDDATEWFDDARLPVGKGQLFINHLHRFFNYAAVDIPRHINIDAHYVNTSQRRFHALEAEEKKRFVLQYVLEQCSGYTNALFSYQFDLLLQSIEEGLCQGDFNIEWTDAIVLLQQLQALRTEASSTYNADTLDKLEKIIQPLYLDVSWHLPTQRLYIQSKHEKLCLLPKVFSYFKQFLPGGIYARFFSQVALNFRHVILDNCPTGLVSLPGYVQRQGQSSLQETVTVGQMLHDKKLFAMIACMYQARSYHLSQAYQLPLAYSSEQLDIEARWGGNVTPRYVYCGHLDVESVTVNIKRDSSAQHCAVVYTNTASQRQLDYRAIEHKTGGLVCIQQGKLPDSLAAFNVDTGQLQYDAIFLRNAVVQKGVTSIAFAGLRNFHVQLHLPHLYAALQQYPDAEQVILKGSVTIRRVEYAVLQMPRTGMASCYTLEAMSDLRSYLQEHASNSDSQSPLLDDIDDQLASQEALCQAALAHLNSLFAKRKRCYASLEGVYAALQEPRNKKPAWCCLFHSQLQQLQRVVAQYLQISVLELDAITTVEAFVEKCQHVELAGASAAVTVNKLV